MSSDNVIYNNRDELLIAVRVLVIIICPDFFHLGVRDFYLVREEPKTKGCLFLSFARAKSHTQVMASHPRTIWSHVYLKCSSLVFLAPVSGGLIKLPRNSSLCLPTDCNLPNTGVSAKRYVKPHMSHDKLFLAPVTAYCSLQFRFLPACQGESKPLWCQE